MGDNLSKSERAERDKMWQQGMHWCSSHKQFLPIKNFYKYKGGYYGYHNVCSQCNRQWYFNQKERHNLRNKKRKAVQKSKFIKLAGEKCQRCGYSEFHSGLEFHHIYSATKNYEPARVMEFNKFEKAWRELDKCCLLCRNCHKAYEAREWRAEFVRRGPGLLGWTVGDPLPLNDDRYETAKPPKVEQAPLPLFNYSANGKQQPALFDLIDTD